MKVNTHLPPPSWLSMRESQLPLARGGHRQNRAREHTHPEPTPLGAPGEHLERPWDRAWRGLQLRRASWAPAGFLLGTARRSWSQGLGASPSAWEQITASGKEREKTHSRKIQGLGAETALPEAAV